MRAGTAVCARASKGSEVIRPSLVVIGIASITALTVKRAAQEAAARAKAKAAGAKKLVCVVAEC